MVEKYTTMYTVEEKDTKRGRLFNDKITCPVFPHPSLEIFLFDICVQIFLKIKITYPDNQENNE